MSDQTRGQTFEQTFDLLDERLAEGQRLLEQESARRLKQARERFGISRERLDEETGRLSSEIEKRFRDGLSPGRFKPKPRCN